MKVIKIIDQHDQLSTFMLPMILFSKLFNNRISHQPKVTTMISKQISGAVKCYHPQILVEIILLQPLRWRCAECAVHHKQNVCEEQYHIYVVQISNKSDLSE